MTAPTTPDHRPAEEALDEFRDCGAVTVRDRGHAEQLLAAWESAPPDGTDYEWSGILHAVARHLLDSTNAPLETLARHIDTADTAIGRARDEHYEYDELSDEAATPEQAGHASAMATLAGLRWSKALGARAALEAAYQELSGGVPSLSHATSTAILAECGLPPNPVGLEYPDGLSVPDR